MWFIPEIEIKYWLKNKIIFSRNYFYGQVKTFFQSKAVSNAQNRALAIGYIGNMCLQKCFVVPYPDHKRMDACGGSILNLLLFFAQPQIFASGKFWVSHEQQYHCKLMLKPWARMFYLLFSKPYSIYLIGYCPFNLTWSIKVGGRRYLQRSVVVTKNVFLSCICLSHTPNSHTDSWISRIKVSYQH